MKLKTIYRLTPPVLGFLAVVNVVVAFWTFVRVRRPVEYKVNVVEAPRFELPTFTNVSEVAARGGLLPERRESAPRAVPPQPTMPDRWSRRYHYCRVNGKPVAVLHGVHVREGDLHAYGVVRSIYPERIYFEGGAYIDNINNERMVDDDYDSPAARAVP